MIVRLCLSLLLPVCIYAQNIIIYFYASETNIDNFKSLKISFDMYLSQFGMFTFQPFHDKEMFEQHLSEENAVIILSSWHYKKIHQLHSLEALLVAQKNGSIKDTKVLIGKKGGPMEGVITSAYDKEYTGAILKEISPAATDLRNVLYVPKEIDALMSVGFGMSSMALVSKGSYEYLQKLNPAMASELEILNAGAEGYKMLLAAHPSNHSNARVVSIFQDMHLTHDGRKQLSLLGIDEMTTISPLELSLIRGVK